MTGRGTTESRTYWHRAVAWGRLAAFAATLKKGAHVQLVGELRTREYEKESGNRPVILSDSEESVLSRRTVKQRVSEVALDSILELDRPEKQNEPAQEAEPSEIPATGQLTD